MEQVWFFVFVWGCFLNGLYWYLLQKSCEARLSSHLLYKFVIQMTGFTQAFYSTSEAGG